ncbi:MAG: RIP metalloprotease RseP [Acidobacteriota bacterium]
MIESILGRILSFIVVLGIMVFFHEFGHFITARLIGVRIETFSFGFGKRLFGIRRKNTDYRVSLIPLGGYVKMAGEEPNEERQGLPDEFLSRKRWERFLILIMGAVMNIILAVFFITLVNLIGVSIPAYLEKQARIGWIEEGSPAEKANLHVGDIILSIDGKEINNWKDVEIIISTNPKKSLQVKIKRNYEVMNLILNTESQTPFEMGYAGFYWELPPKIGFIVSGFPASKAGLKEGDLITKINRKPIENYYGLRKIVRANPNTELTFTVKRNMELKEIKIIPYKQDDFGMIGINPEIETSIKRYSFFSAIGNSIHENWKMAFLVFDVLRKLFSGKISIKTLSGPLEIADFSYHAVRSGFISFISFMALISLQLGIFNLIPIPGLDGGHIFILTLESIIRKDFSLKLKEIVIQIGFGFLILLMVFIIINDIVKKFPKGWETIFPW